MLPAVGSISLISGRTRVDLSEPERPITTKTSPGQTSNDTSAHRDDAAGLRAQLLPWEGGVGRADDAVGVWAEDLPDPVRADQRLAAPVDAVAFGLGLHPAIMTAPPGARNLAHGQERAPYRRSHPVVIAAIPTLPFNEELLRLSLAALLGGAIGIEREMREHEAGLRTHLIVAVGSCLFTLVSAYGFRDFLVDGDATVRADPTRIAAQIVTGIGFLGAGTILRQVMSIRGLTTAATLWAVAAIGLTSGAGYYSAALVTTGIVLLSLWPLRIAMQHLVGRQRERRLSVGLAEAANTAGVVEALERLGVEVSSFSVEPFDGGRGLRCVTELPRGVEPQLVIRRLMLLD